MEWNKTSFHPFKLHALINFRMMEISLIVTWLESPQWLAQQKIQSIHQSPKQDTQFERFKSEWYPSNEFPASLL